MLHTFAGRARRIPPRTLVALFFAAFMALGLLTAPDYGQPWDEVDEMEILRMNIWEYARTLKLPESLFESLAAPNGLSLNKLTPISESVERDHGVAALYPLAPIVLDKSMPQSTRQQLWHMYCWALTTLGAFAIYACCRELKLPRAGGLLAAMFLLLSPRFFAEGHYNSKDVVLMSLVACTLWQALKLARKPAFGTALLFALFGALAANTKIAGVALWALCALYVLVVQIAARRLKGRVLAVGAAALAGFIGFYAMLTPAFISAPREYISYVISNAMSFSRWRNAVRFCGYTFDTSRWALPRIYLPYTIVATTPLWITLMAAVGQVRAVSAVVKGLEARRKKGERRGEVAQAAQAGTGAMASISTNASIVAQAGTDASASISTSASTAAQASTDAMAGTGAHMSAGTNASDASRLTQPLALCLITFMWLIPLSFAIITRTSVYNGWRHFYFIYAPILVLAAYGVNGLYMRLGRMRPRWLKPAFAVMLALCMLFTGIGMALNHPYQYAYYQPAERLMWRDEGYQELDYWNVSVQDALRELCARASGDINISYVDFWTETGLKRAAFGLPQELRARLKITDNTYDADYWLVNPTYALIGGFEPESGMNELIAIEAYGRVIMRIYARETGI